MTRVSIVVKEYEVAQVNALASLGNHQLQRLPRQLLEAFTHDPAAVTGPTRRLRGWRAVDDIHNRLVKQRAICRGFLSEHVNRARFDVGSMLKDPANALENSLESLEQCKAVMQFKAKGVGELLKKVRDIHTNVKTNCNDALSHTSVVYPEVRRCGIKIDHLDQPIAYFSYLSSLLWKRVTKININNFGRLAWTL